VSPIFMPVTRPFDQHHRFLPNLRRSYPAKAAINGRFAITKLISAHLVNTLWAFLSSPR
jgi:hypothetical protein